MRFKRRWVPAWRLLRTEGELCDRICVATAKPELQQMAV
jgi:hypothetical protein